MSTRDRSEDAEAPWSRTNLLIKRAVESLGGSVVPVSRRHTDFLLQLQHGDKRVLISKTRSPFLTQVSQTLSNNKFVCREHFALAGLPAVECVLVDEGDDPLGPEVQALRQRSAGVVIKPNGGNRGVGVSGPLLTDQEVVDARSWARSLDRDEEVVVEPFLPGTDIRISVVGGRALAAAELKRPWLTAEDGRTIGEMLAHLNTDPRRCSWDQPRLTVLDRIEPEEHIADLLQVFGLNFDQQPIRGRPLMLPGEENDVLDRTDFVHPAWMGVAEHACACLGVDVGGVDLRGPIEAFANPPAAEGPRLLEVNVVPGLHVHALPSTGRPRPVFEAFVAYCLSLPGAPLPCAKTPCLQRIVG